MTKAGKKRTRKQHTAARTGPRCPKCDRRTADVGPTEMHWCDYCHAQFDNDPDEGGPSHNDPVRAAIAREEAEALNFLDDLGIYTLGHLRRMSYRDLCDLPRIGEVRASNAWATREELWLKWRKAKQGMEQKKKRSHAKLAKRMFTSGMRQMVLF